MKDDKSGVSQVRSSSKKKLSSDPFVYEMNEPWSADVAIVAEQAYLAFTDVLSNQQQIIHDKLNNAPAPSNIGNNRVDLSDYPKEFQDWVEEYVLNNRTLNKMIENWEMLFNEWLLGTIMLVGEINYLNIPVEIPFSPEGVFGKYDFIDNKLMDWIEWRARFSATEIVGTSADRVRKLIYDTISDGPYSIDKVQSVLQRDYAFSDDRARSIARTEILTAQTTGQFSSDMKFADEGLLLGKVWQASNDERVRHSHQEAHNQFKEFYEPFIVNGELLMYPRDSEMGAGANNVIQCRCTYQLLWKDLDEDKMKQ